MRTLDQVRSSELFLIYDTLGYLVDTVAHLLSTSVVRNLEKIEGRLQMPLALVMPMGRHH